MAGVQTGFDRRVLGALDASPSRVPVVPGGCGAGRTSMLYRLRDRIGRGAAQYVDVERCATTPERFFRAVVDSSPFPSSAYDGTPPTTRAAFEMTIAFLDGARTPGGGPCTFLLDEALELRTFESFPGLRHVLRELLQALATSPNRFVLTSRYVARTHRLLRDATSRFEVMHMPPLSAAEIAELPGAVSSAYEPGGVDEHGYSARMTAALTDGRPSYARKVTDMMAQMGPGADPISALTALLVPGAVLERECHFCYELRLHRARGYGALKAILDILAEEEPLTLTEISLKLRRTPGSTKDYLSWLEDVDLIASHHKRYSFTDPMLRLWVRLHCAPVAPTEDEVARRVQQFAFARLPQQELAPALAYAGGGGEGGGEAERKNWGIIEID
jgi:hypothetical protein